MYEICRFGSEVQQFYGYSRAYGSMTCPQRVRYQVFNVVTPKFPAISERSVTTHHHSTARDLVDHHVFG